MRKKTVIIAGSAAVILAGIASFCIWQSYSGRVYKKCVFEAGVEVQAEDFLKDTKKKIAFAKDSKAVDNKVPGEYTVKLKSGMFTYTCTAVIQDTIPPTAEAADVYYEEGKEIEPEQFVTNIQDVTAVTVAYEKEPDFSYFGEQTVDVSVTDAGDNQITVHSRMISRVTVEEMTLEAGGDFPDLQAFLKNEADAAFVTDTAAIDTKKPGDYTIEIAASGNTYTTLLHIQDTVPPEVEVQNLTKYNSETVDCKEFIVRAKDATALTYAFVKKPDLSQLGEQPLTITVTDAGGNTVQKDVVLTVLMDTGLPVISGAVDITAYLGSSISYKSGVTVWDDHDKNVKLDIDSSAVNTQACGEYPVIYTATDAAGNQTIVTITVRIIERVYTAEEAYQLADGVLAKIIHEGMSPYDKLYAIYKWTRGSIAYVNSSDKSSWAKAACEGLSNRKGDCYTYACVAKALLTRAGIENRDIEKIPGRSRHYWNLVNIGEGWYHFDTTPRKGQSIDFCYISDAVLMNYSAANGNSHAYDRSIYTDIQ